jgi:hypothetical protein
MTGEDQRPMTKDQRPKTKDALVIGSRVKCKVVLLLCDNQQYDVVVDINPITNYCKKKTLITWPGGS